MNVFQAPFKKLIMRISQTAYVRSAIIDRADLSAFKRRPDLRTVSGVTAIALSYVIGWPLISLLGIASVHYGNAAIVALGGPLAYGLSHLVFILGMYLVGAKYSTIFMRWATARGMIRLLDRYGLPLPTAPSPADVGVVAGHDEQSGGQYAEDAYLGHPLDAGGAQSKTGDQGKG